MGLEITKNKLSTILVVGGGISGISSALDLADQGFHVVMVEKDPSIGGRMAQLDKTFPTLDCSICILAPKMVEVYRHPNIDLHTYSEITEVNNEEDNTFSIKIRKKARFVDLDKCTGCGICSEKCPVKKVPSEFEAGLGKRSAIYIPFPQAVPRKATIDKINCMYLSNIEKDLCKNCEKVCPSNAIDFNQKDEIIHIKAASIIVATGFDIINPSK